ncbi:recombinase family protein [Streptosporangium lutulentum]
MIVHVPPGQQPLIPAIGYIRVSMMLEEKISPDIQRASIKELARRRGFRIIEWVEDLDVSGRTFQRKIMTVIADVEAARAKAILVWKYSRFGRNRTGNQLNLARVEKAAVSWSPRLKRSTPVQRSASSPAACCSSWPRSSPTVPVSSGARRSRTVLPVGFPARCRPVRVHPARPSPSPALPRQDLGRSRGRPGTLRARPCKRYRWHSRGLLRPVDRRPELLRPGRLG